MKTETDRRGFGGKVSATRVCVPWRFALFSRVLRCARTGYAREGSSSFFPPAHYRRARFGWVFRVQDGVWYMKWWRRRCEVGIRKPGHRLSRPPLFVLPNSSSNQPSNFALRILVGEMSPRGIADLLIYNENGNRPQRIRGQSQCHSGLRTLALRSLFSCASLCTHRIRERRL